MGKGTLLLPVRQTLLASKVRHIFSVHIQGVENSPKAQNVADHALDTLRVTRKPRLG